jgi:uncharacterized protein (TIGR00255 family)
MTGFGKAECILPTKKLTIELKSLNSKQIDTNTRLPAIYREKELLIRQILSKALERGKIECNFHYEIVDGSVSTINSKVIKEYLKQIKEISEELKMDPGDILSTVMRLPDTVISEKESLEEEEWLTVKATLEKAISELDEFRIQEGTALEKDLASSIETIRRKHIEVEPFEKERLEKIRERIMNNLGELNPGIGIDQNRFEQEIVYYAEKLDINEEKVRLKNHLDYFVEILKKGSPNGKKLGFICQEIGREINTLGSKANHIEIQRLVVDMKDELEKIKEQILNVL